MVSFKATNFPIQMLQFLTVMCHSLILFFHNPCGFPVIHSVIAIGHMALFFILFAQFYLKAYKKTDRKKVDTKSE